jgi:hypothetical protein
MTAFEAANPTFKPDTKDDDGNSFFNIGDKK